MTLNDYIVTTDCVLDPQARAEVNSIVATLPWFPTETHNKEGNYRTCMMFPVTLATRGVGTLSLTHRLAAQRLDELFFAAVGAAGKFYKERFKWMKPLDDTGYEILRYEIGQFYKVHTDHFEKAPRSIAMSLALNDDYEGGEFAFFENGHLLRAAAGHAIMFPSNFMYPHEIKPVTRGTRLSMITWFV